MKKILSVSFICVLLAASFTAFGQEDEKESKDEDVERSFFEGRSSAERVEESARSSESSRARAAESERSAGRARASYRTKAGNTYFVKPDYPASPSMSYSTGDGVFVMSSSGSSTSQLSLSKSFDGQSIENSGSFVVDESVRHISFRLSGSVKEGEIEIVIALPDGDELKDITIDSSADIEFTQSIKISEDDNRYYGEWEYSVGADEAKGHYRLSIQTR